MNRHKKQKTKKLNENRKKGRKGMMKVKEINRSQKRRKINGAGVERKYIENRKTQIKN